MTTRCAHIVHGDAQPDFVEVGFSEIRLANAVQSFSTLSELGKPFTTATSCVFNVEFTDVAAGDPRLQIVP